MALLRPFISVGNQFLRIVRLSRRAFAGYKRELVILALLSVGGTFLEAIGISLLIPLFSFFAHDTAAPTDFISEQIMSLFSFLHIPFTLPSVLTFIVILFFLKAFATLSINYIKLTIKTTYERNTMEKLFRNTLAADWSYLLTQKLGYLETVLVIDVNKTGNFLFAISNAITMFTGFCVYLAVAMTISQTVTVFAVGAGAIIFFGFLPLLRRVRKIARETTTLNKEVARRVNETVGGLKVLKAMAVEDKVGDISTSLFSHLRYLRIKVGLLEQALTVFVQPIGVVLIALIVAFSFYFTAYNLGALIAVVYLVNRVFSNMQEFQGKLHGISAAVPYVESVLAYEQQAYQFREERHVSGTLPFIFNNHIAFKNVTFNYSRSNVPTLKNVSFTLKKGSIMGIVGPSGSGKTTVFDLLLRFFEPAEGKIMLDTKKAQSINLYDWRKNIAYVSQDIFLLNDTVEENIRFFDPDITMHDINHALECAKLTEFVQTLPQGLQTRVGERGIELSGGQRQRIAIARALARGAQILLLDEATSALDKETETSIHQTIANLKGSMTVLIVTHQFSLVRDVDELIVLKEGEVVEQGKPTEMLKEKHSYLHKIAD